MPGLDPEIDDILSRQEKEVRKSFDEFLKSVKNEEARQEVFDLIESGDINGAIDIVNSYISESSYVIPAIVAASGIAIASMVDAPGVGFDISDEITARKVRFARSQYIREITESQRETIASVLAREYAAGSGERKIARALIDSIGLTARQEEAIESYRRLLERGSKRALDRALRDRRFDGSVESGRPLRLEQVDRMVDRYRQKYIRHRAETVARTEAVRAVGLASFEAARQIEESGRRVERTWNATGDQRTRDWHASMDGQKRGIEEPFVDGNGNELMYPGDPNAPAETIINCRCAITLKVA